MVSELVLPENGHWGHSGHPGRVGEGGKGNVKGAILFNGTAPLVVFGPPSWGVDVTCNLWRPEAKTQRRSTNSSVARAVMVG